MFSVEMRIQEKPLTKLKCILLCERNHCKMPYSVCATPIMYHFKKGESMKRRKKSVVTNKRKIHR